MRQSATSQSSSSDGVARARPVGTSWRVDETYIRVKGRGTYLYRAVDKQGLTIDFLLSAQRDIAAAKRFFTRALQQHGAPQRITLDGYLATHSAVAELKESKVLRPEVKVWTSKYLNNIIEQDHRRAQAAHLSNAWLQGLQECDSHHQRYRVSTEDQEAAV